MYLCYLHMLALLGINVTKGRVSLFSLKQVNMPYLFQLPKSSAEEFRAQRGTVCECVNVCV